MAKLDLTGKVTLYDFWTKLPAGTESSLLELNPDGKKGVQQAFTLCGVVSYWVDECSEGVDRGGYVLWVELHDVTYNGKPIQLEAETDQGCLLFAGRDTVL